MPLQPYSCAHCGHWQRWFAPPPGCPVCIDVRNALPTEGWDWRVPGDLTNHRMVSTHVAPGVVGYALAPALGLGSTGWVIDTAAGPVGWEAAGYYPAEAIAQLSAGGGIAALGSSHVHGYGALWQLQDAFGPEMLAIGVQDLGWTKAFQVTDPVDERHELAPGLTMHRSGGHFDGHCVLHDSGRGILFAGDLVKVDLADGRPVGLSSHKAFHAGIPLSPGELTQARELVAGLEFQAVATTFEFAAPVTTKHLLALFDRQLRDRPGTAPIPIEELA